MWRHTMGHLLASKLRSLLAVLGVTIGTAAVVALLSSGSLATQSVIAQFQQLGTNIVAVTIGRGVERHAQSHALELSDIQHVKRMVPSVQEIIGLAYMYPTIRYQGRELRAQTLGSQQSLQLLLRLQLVSGRFLSSLDKTAAFAVIGADIAKQLRRLGVLDPVGAELQVGQRYVTVIGVLAPTKSSFFVAADLNKSIVLRVPALRQIDARTYIRELLVRFTQDTSIPELQTALHASLNAVLDKPRLMFRDPQRLIDSINKQQRTFTWLLGAIGGIALLVGGIGIMNIMLVSVVERRREIGVRLAVGAKPRDVQHLFLWEGVTLSLVGGLIGGLLGELVTWLICLFASWPFELLPWPLFLGFGVSVMVGVFFGYYPALRASRLDPIVALREE